MPAEAEETLVADARGDLTPSQIVEQRLATLLRTGGLKPAPGAEGGRSDVLRG